MQLIEEILYRKTKGLHVQIVLSRREDELLPLIECGCTQMLLQIRDILEDPQMRKEGCARQIRYIRYLFADEGVLPYRIKTGQNRRSATPPVFFWIRFIIDCYPFSSNFL